MAHQIQVALQFTAFPGSLDQYLLFWRPAETIIYILAHRAVLDELLPDRLTHLAPGHVKRPKRKIA